MEVEEEGRLELRRMCQWRKKRVGEEGDVGGGWLGWLYKFDFVSCIHYIIT